MGDKQLGGWDGQQLPTIKGEAQALTLEHTLQYNGRRDWGAVWDVEYIYIYT